MQALILDGFNTFAFGDVQKYVKLVTDGENVPKLQYKFYCFC